ncbi:FtsX-like permease family protein [Aeromicrobium sp.]|uniref:FtsX-like permease family protein n=1 Tax=Aeromicrobium sp. TaxID=1871063 RepID=UPI00199F935E|nr:FtsX-like permease family protein [Aeromicrobium sp.]MBC7633249.1 FtsX-like permease family protein [Aeromicrobium sp.]
MSTGRSLALAGLRANWAAMAGTGLTIALASMLVTVSGVLVESGLRQSAGAGGMLIPLASSFAGTAMVLVVLVVAATTTLALRRRRREFALLSAVGATRGQVRRMISTEILLISAVASPVGAVPGLLLARALDPALKRAGIVGADFVSTLSPWPLLAAVLVVVPTALVASRLAARETVRLAPTAAIRDSATETASVGPVRRITAGVAAVAGLVMASTPLILPGTAGSVLAGSSAFLLVGSAALAGPLLVEFSFSRVANVGAGLAGAPVRLAPVRLALGNLRGFSRRLTTVVVPLALLLAVGTTQTTVDRVIHQAATSQLRAAIGTSLVTTSESGLTEQQLTTLRDIHGVDGVVPLADVPAQVRTDDDDLPDSLVWESTQLRIVPPDVDPTSFDPQVSRGSLSDLTARDTVAISSDAAFDTGKSLDDHLRVRLGRHETSLRIVAVYKRGLGVSDQIIGPRTASALGADPIVSAALLEVASGPSEVSSVLARAAAPGVDTVTSAEYVASVTSPDAASQHLSTLLTLLLLVFVGLGSINALVLITMGRGQELRLLHQGGATSRQLVAMAGVESVATAFAAWAIGTAAVVPGVMGMSFGLLGFGLPAIDLPAYAALSGTVIALAVTATVVPAIRTVRTATRIAH